MRMRTLRYLLNLQVHSCVSCLTRICHLSLVLLNKDVMFGVSSTMYVYFSNSALIFFILMFIIMTVGYLSMSVVNWLWQLCV